MVHLRCTLFLILLHASTSLASEWGNVTGQVILTGTVPDLPLLITKGDTSVKDPVCAIQDVPDDSLQVDVNSKGIANVFVFLNRAPDAIHPDLQGSGKLIFDQKSCRFLPHAMVVRTEQTVLVKSDDPTNHNTHTHPVFNTPENFLIGANNRDGVPLTFRQREPVPIKVTCDIHPWMAAFWLVVDHPYAAVTDASGRFTISNLPAGTHKLRVWHERVGWIERSLSVDVKGDQTTEIPPLEVPDAELATPEE